MTTPTPAPVSARRRSPGRPPDARDGQLAPFDFRFYGDGNRQQHFIVADPWSALQHAAYGHAQRTVALAHIEQARRLYENAQMLADEAKPLLFYYSLLNLAKAYISSRDSTFDPTAPRLKHGLSEPATNWRSRLAFAQHRVHVNPDPNGIFARFCRAADFPVRAAHVWAKDTLAQVIAVQRAFVTQTGTRALHCPVRELRLFFDRDKKEFWARAYYEATYKAWARELSRRQHIRRVWKIVFDKEDAAAGVMESRPITYGRSPADVYNRLRQQLMESGLQVLHTSRGYAYYVYAGPPSAMLPQIVCLYLIFFYLGSVTRYRPTDYQGLLQGPMGWVLHEFLRVGPSQFLFLFASHMLRRPVTLAGAATP